MPGDHTLNCACCGAKISPEVPDYYIELECYRLLREQELTMPRRGSKEYHEAMEGLLPEIRAGYFQNREMYDNGHLWCPVCGNRLASQQGIGDL